MAETKQQKLARTNAWRRERMQDPEYKAKIRAQWRAKYGAGTEGGAVRATRARILRAADPEKYRETHRRQQRKRKYNLTEEQFQAMFAAQGYSCAICRAEQPGGIRDWHIDHDHETLKVRGILCHHCNTGIGLLGTVENLQAAAEYLIVCKETGNHP